jgi:hypothetical protein
MTRCPFPETAMPDGASMELPETISGTTLSYPQPCFETTARWSSSEAHVLS